MKTLAPNLGDSVGEITTLLFSRQTFLYCYCICLVVFSWIKYMWILSYYGGVRWHFIGATGHSIH
jgi:hypothetical protein